MLELEPVARPRAIGPQRAALRLGNAVEEHPLDPDVVVEVLEVPQPLDGAERVRCEIAGAQWAETSSACAFARPDARRKPVIPPQRVTSAWRQSTRPTRFAEVGRDVRVLAGRDLEPGRAGVADQAQPLEVVGGDRLLEPRHVPGSA